MSRTFQGLFFKILRTPQGLAPSECSYKKKRVVDSIQIAIPKPKIDYIIILK